MTLENLTGEPIIQEINTLQQAKEYQVSKHLKSRWLLLLFFIMIVGFLVLRIVFSKNLQKDFVETKIVEPTPTTHPSPKIENIPSGWILKNENGVNFYYPPSLENLVNSKQFYVNVTTKQEIINEYEKYRNSGGCPSTCGILSEDPVLLQKQFAILAKLNNQVDCVFSESFSDELKNDLILFTGGISHKIDIGGMKLKDGSCAIRSIEAGGYDVALDNYHYKVVYPVNDKIIQFTAPIFPTRGFNEVSDLWQNLGYDFETQSCDADCYDNEVKYYENFSLKDPIVQKVISTYDQIVSTLTNIE